MDLLSEPYDWLEDAEKAAFSLQIEKRLAVVNCLLRKVMQCRNS
jgi:hypothetical protein